MVTIGRPAPLRVAVIGAGKMGQNHLRVYNLLKGVEIVAVVDADEQRARSAAERYGCEAHTSLEPLIGRIDAATVAAPSSMHGSIGEFLLSNGIHCLIEKPLAVTEEECTRLINAADKAGVVLLVGHVERFNPAVTQLAEILKDGHTVHAIDARRMSYASSRITDVDVVLDLMVHDLDIILALTGHKAVVGLSAQGVCTSGGRGEDYVNALLSFSDGATASVTASRITQNKIRELQITSDLGFITLNYAAQELMVYGQRKGDDADLKLNPLGNYTLDLAIHRVLIRTAEPLVMEVQHFIDSITKGVAPQVSGTHALEALRLVWRIQEQIRKAPHGNARG